MTTPRAPGDTERFLVTVPEGVLFQDIGNEAVLLSLESGAYYGVNWVLCSPCILVSL